MTEQQRREQIMKMRQQAAPPAAPSLSDADAQRIAGDNGNGLTQEQMIAVAMLGKFVQNDINGIKKAGMGDLKVSNVDMSKVMPSGIAKSMGVLPMPQVPQAIPMNPPPAPVMPVAPVNPVMQPVVPVQQQWSEPPKQPSNQLEFDFDKKARYIEVVEAIEILEKKVNMINEKLDLIIESNKKKLNLTLNENGTQTG